MGYVKCPRCNLNYMLDGEELCNVCKAETGYKEYKVQRSDGSIYDYVHKVFDDFKDYLNNIDTLCELKSITFESNCLPEYGNVHVQQLYLLRYVYAYAYEYKSMYKELFKSYTPNANFSTTSIGCGNMIDYWSLKEALRENGNIETVINYTGIDLIDWQYKMKCGEVDSLCFKQVNAIRYLEEIDGLVSDVYFFPKSISEFSNYDFIKICECFKNKPILKDKFCLLVSIRPVEIWDRTDINRVCSLVDAITSNGFITEDNPDVYYYDDNADAYISYLDPQFNYPDEIKSILKNLTSRCIKENNKQFDCTKCDKIDRNPILSAKYVQYQMFTFYREKQK